MPEYYIGIMCGTSLDSLDLTLCRFGKVNQIKIFKFCWYSFSRNENLSTNIKLVLPKLFNSATRHEPIKPDAPVTIIILQKYIKKLYICPDG